MSQSSSHPSEDRQSAQEDLNGDILEFPMVILSSNSEPLSPEPHQRQPDDPTQMVVLQRKRESDQERKKNLEAVTLMMEEQIRKEEMERQELRKNPARKQSSQSNKAKEMQLRKQFPGYSFLPVESLGLVKEMLEKMAKHPQCKIKSKGDINESIMKTKQDNRNQLARVILLARQELKLIKEGLTQKEERICKNEPDHFLVFAYRTAYMIQENFYNRLYRKSAHKPGEAYFNQIKLVKRQFADRNNIAFRRQIITHSFDMEKLVRATQETLMCEKTKLEIEERKKQLIRQNEKEHQSPISVDDDVIEYPPDIQNVGSIKSTSDLYDEKELPQDKFKREKDNLVRKNKQICKQKYAQISKYVKAMKERIDRLRSSALANRKIQNITFDINMNF